MMMMMMVRMVMIIITSSSSSCCCCCCSFLMRMMTMVATMMRTMMTTMPMTWMMMMMMMTTLMMTKAKPMDDDDDDDGDGDCDLNVHETMMSLMWRLHSRPRERDLTRWTDPCKRRLLSFCFLAALSLPQHLTSRDLWGLGMGPRIQRKQGTCRDIWWLVTGWSFRTCCCGYRISFMTHIHHVCFMLIILSSITGRAVYGVVSRPESSSKSRQQNMEWAALLLISVCSISVQFGKWLAVQCRIVQVLPWIPHRELGMWLSHKTTICIGCPPDSLLCNLLRHARTCANPFSLPAHTGRPQFCWCFAYSWEELVRGRTEGSEWFSFSWATVPRCSLNHGTACCSQEMWSQQQLSGTHNMKGGCWH